MSSKLLLLLLLIALVVTEAQATATATATTTSIADAIAKKRADRVNKMESLKVHYTTVFHDKLQPQIAQMIVDDEFVGDEVKSVVLDINDFLDVDADNDDDHFSAFHEVIRQAVMEDQQEQKLGGDFCLQLKTTTGVGVKKMLVFKFKL